ncbi:MAG: hypothetical protein H6586_00560 [Flavobacteriales bacterium]|nr:hypothetical protein [Flavobacteriales bacterium]
MLKLTTTLLFISLAFFGFSQNNIQLERDVFEYRTVNKSKQTYFDRVLKPGETNTVKFSVQQYDFKTIIALKENLERYFEKIDLAFFDKETYLFTLIYNHQMQRDDLISEFDKLGVNYFLTKTPVQNLNQ